MIDYLRNLFVSWFNKILNWFSERQKKEMNTKKEIPFGKNKHADDDRAKRISEGFQALDEGCKSIANLRAEIEMSQTESKTFKDNEPKVNNDLDAPVPANKIRNTNLNGALAPRKDAMASNDNLEENNMGNFFGPKNAEECRKEIEQHEKKMKKEMAKIKVKEMAKIKELEKKKLEFQKKEGVSPIKPVVDVFATSASPINSNEDSLFLNLHELNDTAYMKGFFAGKNEQGQKIEKLENQLVENTNDMNNLKEQVNKNTEDIKEVNKKVDKIQEDQFDLKAMLAEMKQQTAKMDEDRKIEAEKWREHDAKWMEIFGPYLKKNPTREGSDNRESTNTSFSSFKYKNPFRNNTRQPKMEKPDMAYNHG